MPALAPPAGGEDSQTIAQMETPRCTVPGGATCKTGRALSRCPVPCESASRAPCRSPYHQRAPCDTQRSEPVPMQTPQRLDAWLCSAPGRTSVLCSEHAKRSATPCKQNPRFLHRF